MRKTASFAAVVILLAGVAVAAPPTTQELLRHVPAAATVVVAVDCAALRSQPLVQQWLLEHQTAWSGHDADVDRFLSDAGLDPLRDVDTMIVAIDSEKDGEVLALFAGRYDPTSLGAAMVKQGATASKVNGVDVFTLPADHPNAKHDQAVVALPSAELVIAGDAAAVQAALTGGRVQSNLATTEIAAGRVDPRAHFWAVAVVPEQVRRKAGEVTIDAEGEGGEMVRGLLTAGGTVKRVAVQASLGKELELSGVALSDSKEDAELLRDSAKGAVAAMRLHVKDRSPELVEVLREVDIRADGTQVSGRATVPVQLILKWMSETKEHRHGHECEKTH